MCLIEDVMDFQQFQKIASQTYFGITNMELKMLAFSETFKTLFWIWTHRACHSTYKSPVDTKLFVIFSLNSFIKLFFSILLKTTKFVLVFYKFSTITLIQVQFSKSFTFSMNLFRFYFKPMQVDRFPIFYQISHLLSQKPGCVVVFFLSKVENVFQIL